ncbi:hypothetical protein HY380_00290 [Candidatus Saccharibacteria bacterium]|nr:hypothetical protein [Candidatus Saccharibacteria bacterium]
MVNYIAAVCRQGTGLIDPGKANIPCTNANDQTVQTIFFVVFGIIGGLLLVFMVIAGARYALSKGEPDNIQQAKNELKYTLIGIAIVALAAAIVNFVINNIQT